MRVRCVAEDFSLVYHIIYNKIHNIIYTEIRIMHTAQQASVTAVHYKWQSAAPRRVRICRVNKQKKKTN